MTIFAKGLSAHLKFIAMNFKCADLQPALTCAKVVHMLTKRKKQNVMSNTARHDTDTGSPEVQVGLLTRKIEELASHLKKQPKDIHSRRGLLGMVADRRAHLKYLEKKNKRAYNALLKKLDLKK